MSLPTTQLRTLQIALLGVALLLAGCASYQDDTKALRNAWKAGNDASAASIAAAAAADKDDGVDQIVFRLEEGSALRAAGNYQASIKAFDDADAEMKQYDAGAEIRLAAEAGATLTNLSYLPYTGTAYDKIMLNTYQALNYLQLGQYDDARVFLNRALERQREAVNDNAQRIAEATAAAEKSSDKAKASKSSSQQNQNYDVERAERDPQFQRNISSVYGYLDQLKAYAPYVNPFTVYLDGVFHLAQAADLPDVERAAKDFQRTASMIGTNDYLAGDDAAVKALLSGQPMTPATYVFFETGMAPYRDETRIDIPVFIFGAKGVPYVGAAFPKLKMTGQYVPYLDVAVGSQTFRTKTLCSMDSVIAQEFDNELPIIITKTLISAGAKAAITYGLYEATKDNSNVATAIMIAGAIYQAAMNSADLRSWITLPKEVQFARFATPASRKLTLTQPVGGQKITVTLEPGVVNVVYVKSNSNMAPLRVTQFVLKPDPTTNETRLL
ncbi:COG3014 family protein [Cerasicoccus maritimus]|uniref:COG3014 family protein n=1 Tax=Cerasicoccus maritimus TaxID=490089 RepID=UPI0028526E3C|nr:hypothetical protein [Cerasicoccus maritimus]